MQYRRLIISPVISEKSMEAGEAQGKYSFRVPLSANKIEIRRAVEALFNVRVLSVNTINVKGKHRRQNIRHRMGKTADWKKAVVKLAPGERIDVMQSG
ncbi:MAG: 50S ribosomal protein L23 [candidate division WS1 bacterium]|nr:50S ribosomal protein L23 [candidate division WS1 bacterium]